MKNILLGTLALLLGGCYTAPHARPPEQPPTKVIVVHEYPYFYPYYYPYPYPSVGWRVSFGWGGYRHRH